MLTSLALQVLHFEQFLKTVQKISPQDDEVEEEGDVGLEDPDSLSDPPEEDWTHAFSEHDFVEIVTSLVSGTVTPESFQDQKICSLMKQYFKYKEETLKGNHGKTAQYYMNVVSYIHNYQMLSRSVRSGN